MSKAKNIEETEVQVEVREEMAQTNPNLDNAKEQESNNPKPEDTLSEDLRTQFKSEDTDFQDRFNDTKDYFDRYDLYVNGNLRDSEKTILKMDFKANLRTLLYDVHERCASKTKKKTIFDNVYMIVDCTSKRKFNSMCKEEENRYLTERETTDENFVYLHPRTKPTDYFQTILSKIKTNLYYDGSQIVQEYLVDKKLQVRIPTEDELSGLINETLYVIRGSDDQACFSTVRQREVVELMNLSSILKGALKPLKMFTKIPGFTADFTLHQKKYCEQSEVLYYGPEVKPKRHQAEFDTFMNFFAFESGLDKNRFFAYLVLLTLRYYMHCNFPLLIITGPSGVGKTTLMMTIAELFNEGDYVDVASSGQDEFKKAVASAIRFGKNVITLDNQVFSKGFEALDSLATQKKLSFRLLGQNRHITRPYNDLILMMTVNGGQLSIDTRRRSIMIGLNSNFSAQHQAITDIREDILPYVRDNRDSILSHLFWIVLETKKKIPGIFEYGRTKGWKQLSTEILHAFGSEKPIFRTSVYESYLLKQVLKILLSEKDGFCPQVLWKKLERSHKNLLRNQFLYRKISDEKEHVHFAAFLESRQNHMLEYEGKVYVLEVFYKNHMLWVKVRPSMEQQLEDMYED